MKISEIYQKSFISLRNEEGVSYFSEIPIQQEKNERKPEKSNKCEILTGKFDKNNESSFLKKHDWGGILVLEKEKIELMRDNFKKEKLIFESMMESQTKNQNFLSKKETFQKLLSKKNLLNAKIKAWKNLENIYLTQRNSSNGK